MKVLVCCLVACNHKCFPISEIPKPEIFVYVPGTNLCTRYSITMRLHCISISSTIVKNAKIEPNISLVILGDLPKSDHDHILLKWLSTQKSLRKFYQEIHLTD